MMVASIPPDFGRIEAQGCAISRGSAVMAVTANRLRIGHPNFVKAVLRNLHTLPPEVPRRQNRVRDPKPHPFAGGV